MKNITRSTVALVSCPSYDPPVVHSALARGFDILGGAAKFFRPGEKIVLKPNVLSGTNPSLCIVTHPSVFIECARIMQAERIQLSYGDSPAVGLAAGHMRKAGYAEFAESLGIPLADFDEGRVIKHPAALICGSFHVANGILDADGVVSICKLKTHGLVRLTGAVKNQLGCIPGLFKAQSHARYPMPDDFAAWLVDINMFIRPRLYIMDAVYAMEGNGPNSGDPKKLGVILISADPVALDACACRITDMPPHCVPTCVHGERGGLGTYRPEAIDIAGDSIEQFIDKSFRVVRKPPVAVYGTGLKRLIKSALAPRPRVHGSVCTRCGKCVDICPARLKALFFRAPGRTSPPRFESSHCIRCFCCQETCPSRAITVETLFAARVASASATSIVRVMHRINAFRRLIKNRKRMPPPIRRTV